MSMMIICVYNSNLLDFVILLLRLPTVQVQVHRPAYLGF